MTLKRALSRMVGLSRSYRKTVWLVLFSQLKSHIKVCCKDKKILYINFLWRQLYHQFETQVLVSQSKWIPRSLWSHPLVLLPSNLFFILYLIYWVKGPFCILVLQSSHFLYHYLKNPKILRLESSQYLFFLSISIFSKDSLEIILVKQLPFCWLCYILYITVLWIVKVICSLQLLRLLLILLPLETLENRFYLMMLTLRKFRTIRPER